MYILLLYCVGITGKLTWDYKSRLSLVKSITIKNNMYMYSLNVIVSSMYKHSTIIMILDIGLYPVSFFPLLRIFLYGYIYIFKHAAYRPLLA